MAHQLLTDLLDNTRRLQYTIDDCYTNPKILDWQPFLDELAEDLEPLQRLFPKVKKPLDLVQKYYTKYVDVTAILEQADKDIEQLNAQIQELQTHDQKQAQQEVDIQNTQKELKSAIQQFQKELQKYKQLNQELIHEQSVLSPLTDKTKYKKIYKEIEQQAAQYNIGILECESSIAERQKQIEGLQKDAATLQQNRENIAANIQQLQQQIQDTEAHKSNAQQQPDYQEETQALERLEAFFQQKSPATHVLHQNILPKNWRNILDTLLKSRLPHPAGWLRAVGDALPQLQRTSVSGWKNALAFALSSLLNGLNQKLGIQFDDCAFLPISPSAQARISFREKGRVVAALSQNNSEDEEDEENQAKTAEIFLRNDHEQAIKTHPNTIADLYILFQNYVIEIDFVGNI